MGLKEALRHLARRICQRCCLISPGVSTSGEAERGVSEETGATRRVSDLVRNQR